jgi:hypothetical protein
VAGCCVIGALENCVQAPNVVVDGTVFGGITPDRAERFFEDCVLSRINADAVTGDNIDQ